MNKSSTRFIVPAACVLLAAGIAFGAFGSHALQESLSPLRLGTWQTAVQYHLMIAVALLVLGLGKPDCQKIQTGALVLMMGLLLFSGSLYTLCLTDIRLLGIITPIGGLLMIAACLYLAWAFSHNRDES